MVSLSYQCPLRRPLSVRGLRDGRKPHPDQELRYPASMCPPPRSNLTQLDVFIELMQTPEMQRSLHDIYAAGEERKQTALAQFPTARADTIALRQELSHGQ